VTALDRLRARGEPDAPRRSIGTVGIVTRDRPRALARCLGSFGSHVVRHGRRARFVVVDGAQAPSALSASREVLGAFTRELGLEAVQVSETGKRAYAERLAVHLGADPALLRFALLDELGAGTDTGANRNALLLGCAGEALLSADDDTVCELGAWPDAPGGLSLSSRRDPTSVIPFADREAALAALRSVPGCLLDMHEGLMGRTVSACLREVPDERVDLADLAPRTADVLTHTGAKVVASFTGLAGDCGARYPSFYLWSGAARSLLDDDDRYAALLHSRQVVRLVARPTIGSGGFSMSTGFALDAGLCIPPFFPVMRGADLTFGQIVTRCDETALFAYLPVAIGHHPLDVRRVRREDLWERAPEVNTYGLLSCCLSAVGASLATAARGEARLRLMGRLLTELAALPAPELEVLLAERRARVMAHQLSTLERLADGSAGRLWVKDFARYRQGCQEVIERGSLAPADLPGSEAEAMALFRRCLDHYGRLLQIWPEVHAAAATLRRRGAGLWLQDR
jgi:hypothetical protein